MIDCLAWLCPMVISGAVIIWIALNARLQSLVLIILLYKLAKLHNHPSSLTLNAILSYYEGSHSGKAVVNMYIASVYWLLY